MKKFIFIFSILLLPCLLYSQITIEQTRELETVLSEEYVETDGKTFYRLTIDEEDNTLITSYYFFVDDNPSTYYSFVIMVILKKDLPQFINYLDKNTTRLESLKWISTEDRSTFYITIPDKEEFAYIILEPF